MQIISWAEHSVSVFTLRVRFAFLPPAVLKKWEFWLRWLKGEERKNYIYKIRCYTDITGKEYCNWERKLKNQKHTCWLDKRTHREMVTDGDTDNVQIVLISWNMPGEHGTGNRTPPPFFLSLAATCFQDQGVLLTLILDSSCDLW